MLLFSDLPKLSPLESCIHLIFYHCNEYTNSECNSPEISANKVPAVLVAYLAYNNSTVTGTSSLRKTVTQFLCHAAAANYSAAA